MTICHKTFFVLISLALATAAFADDFRGATCGMTRQQVIELEGSPPEYQSAGAITFLDDVAGFEVVVIYGFVKATGELAWAGYSFLDTHTNENQYLSDFRSIEGILKNKYGQMKSSDEYWNDDLYRDDPSDHGMAILVGDYSLYNVWETPSTKIIHSLSGENFEANHGVSYYSHEYFPLVEAEDSQEDSDDF